MEVKQVHALCYSATGVTEKVVRALAAGLEEELGLSPAVFHGFRKPDERSVDHVFGPGDLVVVGSPTYAGRMPNKIMPDFQALSPVGGSRLPHCGGGGLPGPSRLHRRPGRGPSRLGRPAGHPGFRQADC